MYLDPTWRLFTKIVMLQCVVFYVRGPRIVRTYLTYQAPKKDITDDIFIIKEPNGERKKKFGVTWNPNKKVLKIKN